MLLKIPFVLTPQVSALIDLTKKASLGILRKARERTRGPEQGCPLGRWGRILVTNRGCAGHSGSCDGEHRGNPSSCSSGILCTVTGTSEPGHSLWLAGSPGPFTKNSLHHPIPLVSKGWWGGRPPFSARFMVLLFSSSGGGSGYSPSSGMISVASFLKACHPWPSTTRKAACTSRQTRHRASGSCMVPARGGHAAFQ